LRWAWPSARVALSRERGVFEPGAPDTGAGARLGAFESRVNGIGPLVTYTLGDPKDPLTVIAKYYKEFDAENTFEGESFDIAVTAKF
jgi:hypothetical protein